MQDNQTNAGVCRYQTQGNRNVKQRETLVLAMAKKIKSNQVAYSPTLYLNASNPIYLRDKPGNK